MARGDLKNGIIRLADGTRTIRQIADELGATYISVNGQINRLGLRGKVRNAIARKPADLAQAPAPVRVKPLVWAQEGKQPEHAVSIIGTYLLVKDFDGWRWMRVVGGNLADVCLNPFSDVEAAKAAAQADYEARILAALEPDAGVVAELVEAAEEAIEALDYSAAEIADLENTLSSYRENWRDAKDAAVRLRGALALIAHNTTEG